MYDVIGDADTFSLVSGVYENDTADIGEIDDERRRKKSAEDLRKIRLRVIIMIVINICIICISV